MRKIEIWMIDTIVAQRCASKDKLMRHGLTNTKGNTMVCTRLCYDGNAITTVYLYGNIIAQYFGGKWRFKLAGWNTPITRNRINVLAVHWGRSGVYQRRGKVFSGEEEVNIHDWF